jgi:fatty-acyl-CoA synthase
MIIRKQGERNMGSFITVSEALSMAAYLYPEKVGAKDLNRAMAYRELNERCCRLETPFWV